MTAVYAFALFAGLAAGALSPDFVAAYLSRDHQLGAYVVGRIQLARVLLAFVAAGAAAWAAMGASRRARLLERSSAALRHPAAAPVAFLLGLAFIATELNIYEWEPISEGAFAYGAVRALNGEVPCRDFFTYVPPGWFYALAAVFRVFGVSLDAARVAVVMLPKFLCAILLHALARRVVSRPAALAAAGFALLFLSPNPNAAEIHPAALTVLLALGSLFALVRFFETGERWPLAFSGALAAGTALLRQDFGLYALLAGLCGLGLALARGGVPGLQRVGAKTKALASYLGAWGIVAGGAAVAMLRSVDWDLLTECYVWGPAAYMSHSSTWGWSLIPFHAVLAKLRGEFGWSQMVSQFLIADTAALLTWSGLAVGAWLLVRALRRGRPLAAAELTAGAVFFFSLFFMGYAFKGGARPYIGSTPSAVILLLAALQALRDAGAGGRAARLLIPAGIAGYALVLAFFRPMGPPPESWWLRLPVGRLLCRTTEQARNLGAAIGHVQRVVPPEGKIFVYKARRHRTLGNFVLFYFLAERAAVTRYHELFGGITVQVPAQERMIRELSDPALGRIIETDPDEGEDPNPGKLLDDHIRANFVPEAKFGEFTILRRK